MPLTLPRRRRRLGYDTEFIEDGRTIHFVSIGILEVDKGIANTQYYAVNADLDVDRLLGRPWLRDNVAPYLPWEGGTPDSRRLDLTDGSVKPLSLIAKEAAEFILGGLADDVDDDDPPVRLWADYPAYDHVLLHQLWGGMQGRPRGMPMRTSCLRQLLDDHGLTAAVLPPRTIRGEHPALADAQDLGECLRAVDEVLANRHR